MSIYFYIPWILSTPEALVLVTILLVGLRSLSHHLLQLPLLGKFAAQYAKIGNETSAGFLKRSLWGKRTVGLNTQDEFAVEKRRLVDRTSRSKGGLPDERMGNFVASEFDM